MSDVSALSVALLRRVAQFLDGLPEDHIADLAEGRARLTYVPWGATEPLPPALARRAPVRKAADVKVNSGEMVAALERADTRDEGRRILAALTVTDLRAVAKEAGMRGYSKTVRDELLEQIVSFVIGRRASRAAMRNAGAD